jgi:DNA mismatch repair protein MutS2
VDLDPATSDGLDWPVVREALAGAARTPMCAEALRAGGPLAHPLDAEVLFDAVDEVRGLEASGAFLPVGGVGDARVEARRAARGEVLEGPELARAGQSLTALHQLARMLDRHAHDAPTLARYAAEIIDDPDVREELAVAFDATGGLSAVRYPVLGALRARIADLHDEIRATLERMLRDEGLADVLQDRFWTQRENRYVLPIKAHAKRMDYGIVHGTSGSGQTVFVEPHAVLSLNNRLRLAEGELRAEEYRILASLSRMLGAAAPAVERGVDAAIAIDQACAREHLARQLGATRPIVGRDGVVRLGRGRHPVLTLRGVAVVGSDLGLDSARPGLVISGPNAGGKTVALKTIGLAALLVRHGCYIPAEEGSRVDWFDDVRAVIGDQQTVEGDLSSFSAHLVALDAIVRAAGPGSLVLLDELASGTDPAQGAAIGQALLERLVSVGARVVVTTHFGPLKRLSSVDARFGAAAVQSIDGRPTYAVVSGVSGESHAFGIAQRIGLDPALIARATELVGAGERSVSATLEQLEGERARWQAEADGAARLRAELVRREAALAQSESAIAQGARKLEFEAAQAFLQRVRQAEKAIKEILSALRAEASEREAELALASVSALRGVVPARPAPAVDEAPVEVEVGDRVRLREYDLVGEVIAVGEGGIRVRAGPVTVQTRPEQLERLPRGGR